MLPKSRQTLFAKNLRTGHRRGKRQVTYPKAQATSPHAFSTARKVGQISLYGERAQ